MVSLDNNSSLNSENTRETHGPACDGRGVSRGGRRSEDVVPAMMRFALWAAITSSNLFPAHIIRQFDPLFSPTMDASSTTTVTGGTAGPSSEYLQFARLESVQNMVTKLRAILRQQVLSLVASSSAVGASATQSATTTTDSIDPSLGISATTYSNSRQASPSPSVHVQSPSSAMCALREQLQQEVVALQIELSRSEAGRLTAELRLREVRVQMSAEQARLVAENERLRLNRL